MGDDLYSYGFDGAYLWTGGRSSMVVPSLEEPHVRKGDNIGCALDLSVPIITFFYNGIKIPGYFRNFNLDGMFFPVISASAKISCRFLFGGEHGRLKYTPPDGFSPIYDSLLPTQILAIDPCFYFGELAKGVLAGPLPVEDDVAFVPQPVDTTTVSPNIAVLCFNKYLTTSIPIFHLHSCHCCLGVVGNHLISVSRLNTASCYLYLGSEFILKCLLTDSASVLCGEHQGQAGREHSRDVGDGKDRVWLVLRGEA